MRQSEQETVTVDGTVHTTVDRALDAVLTCLDDHKAEDIVTIELAGKSSIADYMVVATGNSSRQVAALAETVAQVLKDEFGIVGIKPEGARQGDWVLIDAGDIIIHLFRPEVRAFYNLEKMWSSEISESEKGVTAPH